MSIGRAWELGSAPLADIGACRFLAPTIKALAEAAEALADIGACRFLAPSSCWPSLMSLAARTNPSTRVRSPTAP